jgi:hypothetical protein
MELKNIKRIYIFVIQFLSATVVRNHDDFLRLDNRGGLVLPFGGKTYADEDWLEYQRLTIDESVKSINPSDLPIDFCDDACRLVDEFRRKTVNEKVEWMLYFDYTNGDVIYC